MDREITLRDYGRVLWGGRWLILGATVAAAVVGLLLSIASPTTYTATSQVFLGQATTPSGAIAQTAATSPETAPEILSGRDVVRRVAERAGVSPGRVRGAVEIDVPDGPGTQNQPSLATITATDGTRRVAVDIAEAYARAVFSKVSESFERVQGTYRDSLARDRAEIDRLKEQLAGYRQQLLGAPPETRVLLQSLIFSAQDQLATTQTAATQAEIQLATAQQFAPEIADLPGGATSSGNIRNRAQTVLFAAVIGLLVGITVTFVWRGSPAGRGRREA